MTRPLAENVADSWVDSRFYRWDGAAGDVKMQAAVAFVQARPVRSTTMYTERAFHQNDIGGLADLVFRAGWRWITLHHLSSWLDIWPNMSKAAQARRVQLLADTLDGENIFQNYLLSTNETETVILTNGYCITTYSPPLKGYELYQLEAGAPGKFRMGGWDPIHGPYRAAREEHKTKRTAWFSSITSAQPSRDSYTLTYEYKSPGGGMETWSIDWVVAVAE